MSLLGKSNQSPMVLLVKICGTSIPHILVLYRSEWHFRYHHHQQFELNKVMILLIDNEAVLE
jgi:hypothetical protein